MKPKFYLFITVLLVGLSMSLANNRPHNWRSHAFYQIQQENIQNAHWQRLINHQQRNILMNRLFRIQNFERRARFDGFLSRREVRNLRRMKLDFNRNMNRLVRIPIQRNQRIMPRNRFRRR